MTEDQIVMLAIYKLHLNKVMCGDFDDSYETLVRELKHVIGDDFAGVSDRLRIEVVIHYTPDPQSRTITV